jgi:hypothetical protein
MVIRGAPLLALRAYVGTRRLTGRDDCGSKFFIESCSFNALQFEVTVVTITRVGTNAKYADGWDAAFSGKRSAGKKSASKAKKPAAKKASAKKSAKKAKK